MQRILLLGVVLVLWLSGCGASDPGPPGAASSDAGPSVVGTGKAADLGFSGTTIDGSTFSGRSLEGTTTVLWFWAPWCPTCRAQSANVSDLGQRYDDVAVVGVGGLDSAAAIAELASEIPHVRHLVDDSGEVWQHFRVTEQSTYTVIDAEGEIVSEGYLDDAELNDLVARLAGRA